MENRPWKISPRLRVSASPRLRVSHRTYRYDVGSMKHDVGSTVEIQYVRAINPPRMTDFYYKHVAFRYGKSPVENISASPRLRVSHRTYRYDVGSMKHDVGSTVEIQYVRAINPPRML